MAQFILMVTLALFCWSPVSYALQPTAPSQESNDPENTKNDDPPPHTSVIGSWKQIAHEIIKNGNTGADIVNSIKKAHYRTIVKKIVYNIISHLPEGKHVDSIPKNQYMLLIDGEMEKLFHHIVQAEPDYDPQDQTRSQLVALIQKLNNVGFGHVRRMIRGDVAHILTIKALKDYLKGEKFNAHRFEKLFINVITVPIKIQAPSEFIGYGSPYPSQKGLLIFRSQLVAKTLTQALKKIAKQKDPGLFKALIHAAIEVSDHQKKFAPKQYQNIMSILANLTNLAFLRNGDMDEKSIGLLMALVADNSAFRNKFGHRLDDAIKGAVEDIKDEPGEEEEAEDQTS